MNKYPDWKSAFAHVRVTGIPEFSKIRGKTWRVYPRGVALNYTPKR